MTLLTRLQQIGPRFQPRKVDDLTLDAHMRDPALLPEMFDQQRKYITSYDPATTFHLGTYPADDAETITNKIRLAVGAQGDWAKSSFADRRKVMRSLKKWLVDNQKMCAEVAARDTGKTRTWHPTRSQYCSDKTQSSMRRWAKY